MKALLVKQASALLLVSALSLATALSATTPAGQPAISGPVNFSITNPTVPVYDLTGSYQFDHLVGLARGKTVDVSLGLAVQQDAAGGLRGAGVTNIQVGDELVRRGVQGQRKGHGRRRQTDPRDVVGPLGVAGPAVGTNGAFTISVVYTLEVSRGSLDGAALGLAKFAKLGSGTHQGARFGRAIAGGRGWELECEHAAPAARRGRFDSPAQRPQLPSTLDREPLSALGPWRHQARGGWQRPGQCA